MPVLAAMLDRNGCFVEVSDAWVSRTGHTREVLRGRRPEDVATPDSARLIREEHLPRFRRTGRLDNVPIEFLTTEGVTLKLLATTTGEYDEQGAFLYSLSVFTEPNSAEVRLSMNLGRIAGGGAALKTMLARIEAVADAPATLRELKNVIERAVILSTGDALPLDRPLPEAQLATSKFADQLQRPAETIAGPPFITETAMREQQRVNILAALEAAGWRISGHGGAAELLGVRPTTLSDRMRALRISRPTRTIT